MENFFNSCKVKQKENISEKWNPLLWKQKLKITKIAYYEFRYVWVTFEVFLLITGTWYFKNKLTE